MKVFFKQTFGAICNSDWSDTDASVVRAGFGWNEVLRLIVVVVFGGGGGDDVVVVVVVVCVFVCVCVCE